MHSLLACTTRAAIEGIVRLNAVSDDLTTAVIAHGRQLMDRALQAVKDVGLTRRDDLEGEVVIVPADFTLSHGRVPFVRREVDRL